MFDTSNRFKEVCKRLIQDCNLRAYMLPATAEPA
jgi:CHAT domain-containing protein